MAIFPFLTHRPLLILGLISLLITGCASTKESVLPQDGPTMKTIFEGHMTGLNQEVPVQKHTAPLAQPGIDHYTGYLREAANEIDSLFPRLPNPTLVMYVFPHLSGEERHPVPGYVTSFPFYDTVEYALPGEVTKAIRAHRPGYPNE